jgi:hypothetical protein
LKHCCSLTALLLACCGRSFCCPAARRAPAASSLCLLAGWLAGWLAGGLGAPLHPTRCECAFDMPAASGWGLRPVARWQHGKVCGVAGSWVRVRRVLCGAVVGCCSCLWCDACTNGCQIWISPGSARLQIWTAAVVTRDDLGPCKACPHACCSAAALLPSCLRQVAGCRPHYLVAGEPGLTCGWCTSTAELGDGFRISWVGAGACGRVQGECAAAVMHQAACAE